MSGTTPGPSDQSLAALRQAVSELTRRPTQPDELRAAVCALAHEARAQGVAPERLLVAMKSAWHAASTVPPGGDQRAQTRLFEQMVSLCIAEYFT